jgi:hypothetical protein
MFNYFNPDSKKFNSQLPFPHFVEYNLWDNDFLKKIENEFSNFTNWDGQKNFVNAKWKNFCGSYDKFPENTKILIDFAMSNDFIKFLERVTGIESLLPDNTFMGGGMHNTSNGGFLEMHADFNFNENLGLYRRLNLLIYLNSNWEDKYGGFLEIQDANKECHKFIKPKLNTTVLFVTDDDSIHGHPIPMNLPNNITRKSIALYYYTKEKPQKGHYSVRNSTKYYSDKKEKQTFLRKFINFFK